MRAKDNPFAADRVEALGYRCRSVLFTDLLERLEASKYRGAIVGPQGSGKTALLESLEPRLKQAGFETIWLQLSAATAANWQALRDSLWERLSGSAIVLFDGADLISAWEWYLFYRRANSLAGGMIITAHAPGRLPTLITCRPNLQLLETIIQELTGSGLDPQTARLTGDLFRRHHGNMREVLREWYDIYALR